MGGRDHAGGRRRPSLLIDPHDDLLDWLVAMLSVTTAWLVGNNVRTQRAYGEAMAARAADLERDRQAEAERAVADERLRLARELHDVAAHHVSVIALHAEAGQSLLPGDPDRRRPSPSPIIGDVARTTLTRAAPRRRRPPRRRRRPAGAAAGAAQPAGAGRTRSSRPACP